MEGQELLLLLGMMGAHQHIPHGRHAAHADKTGKADVSQGVLKKAGAWSNEQKEKKKKIVKDSLFVVCIRL